jgi:DNA (cytosine-5)-methyltransferase 1
MSPILGAGSPLAVIDLFAGIGGMSAGFQQEGFSVEGFERDEVACEFFRRAGFGKATPLNLGSDPVSSRAPVVIGGPPCRPWSPVNLQRRRDSHDDHKLLASYVDHVLAISPSIFVMENVPALGSDPLYGQQLARLKEAGFDVLARPLHYDRYGAATRRRRLFTVGVRATGWRAHDFFALLDGERREAATVKDAIWWLRETPRGAVPDHDWSELRSIGNYRDKYVTGEYGWRRLVYDQPAPSFGSVAKTYILHPDAGVDGFPERVLSVREVLSIMGFPRDASFPEGTARARRYQMVANAVSPIVSGAVARAIRSMLTGKDMDPCHRASAAGIS